MRVYDRACVRTLIYIRMHLYPREFAFVYMHKRKRSFLRAFACVRLHACVCVCLRAELIKRLRAKYFNTQTHFGFKNFQDVLYTNGMSSMTLLYLQVNQVLVYGHLM